MCRVFPTAENKSNGATKALATTLLDVCMHAFSPCCLIFVSKVISPASPCPPFLVFFRDRRTAAVLTANEGQGFCYVCVCVCDSLRTEKQRECLCVCACLCWVLDEGKARSRKRSGEKIKGAVLSPAPFPRSVSSLLLGNTCRHALNKAVQPPPSPSPASSSHSSVSLLISLTHLSLSYSSPNSPGSFPFGPVFPCTH